MADQRSNRAQRRSQRDQALQSELPRRIEAQYIKSNYSRVVHADGAYGGPTVQGLIYMALFSEHTKLPEFARYVIDHEHREARPEPSKGGNVPVFVREVEVEVLLSLPFAKKLRQWLDDKIRILEAQVPEDQTISVIESQS